MSERLRRSDSTSRTCASARSRTSGRGAARGARCSASPDTPTWCRPDRSRNGRAIRSRPSIRDGLLYGRGAADMKSGLAAMLTACEEFVARAPAPPRQHRVPDHQRRGGAVGRRHAPRGRGAERAAARRIDWCLVGEPSSENVLGDTIKIGRRGSLSGRLTVHGVQGHIAYPQLADNPDPRARARARRARLAQLGSRQRALSADQLSGVEHRRRHRRAERDPGRAQGALQPALLDRADRRVAAGDRRAHPARARRQVLARLVHLRLPVPDGARHLVGGRGARSARSSR